MFFFMFCMTILTPVSISVVGMVMRKHPVRNKNWGMGYRSGRSMKSQEAWDFAQTYCAGIWMKWGAGDGFEVDTILAVKGIAFMLDTYEKLL